MKKITLPNNKYTLVDDEDFVILSQYKWHSFKNRNTFYCHRNIYLKNVKRSCVTLHRQIMGNPKNKIIDHIDGNGLNNLRSNLRIVTNSQNLFNRGKQNNNTSGLKRISWHKREKKWRADIGINGKQITLGYFKTKEEAYKVYIEACKKYHGKLQRQDTQKVKI